VNVADAGDGSMTDTIRRLYFVGHHFTRDLIGTIAPVTASALAFVALYPPVRWYLVELFERNGGKLNFWGFLLTLCIYAICAYFIGAMANILGTSFIGCGNEFRVSVRRLLIPTGTNRTPQISMRCSIRIFRNTKV
jgi:hypothetical protein